MKLTKLIKMSIYSTSLFLVLFQIGDNLRKRFLLLEEIKLGIKWELNGQKNEIYTKLPYCHVDNYNSLKQLAILSFENPCSILVE